MTFEELKQVSNVSEENRKHFDNLILVIRCGSHLYALNNENSDEDFIGVFINPINEYFSMHQRVDLVDFSVVDKLENGKNSKDAVDFKAYSLPKFMSLLKSNNPTIFELLFASKENIVFSNEFGNMLIENRDLFLSSNAVNSFFGYAEQQKKKFFTKKETFFSLAEAKDYLLNQDKKTYLTELIANDKTEFFKVFSDKGFDLVYVADIGLNKNQTVKRAIGLLDTRIGECSNRVDLIKEKGFDTKYTSHYLRLMAEFLQLANNNTISFPLNDEIVAKTKRGEFEIAEVHKHMQDYYNRAKEVKHKLEPLESKTTEINELTIEITRKFFGLATEE